MSDKGSPFNGISEGQSPVNNNNSNNNSSSSNNSSNNNIQNNNSSNSNAIITEPTLSNSERHGALFGREDRMLSLPFFRPYNLPRFQGEPPVDPGALMNSCASKTIMGAVMGGGMGFMMGIFLGAMSDMSPINVSQGREVPQGPIREQLRQAFKQTGAKSFGWARNFGGISFLFGGVDCVIEKYRGKHDVWNPVLSGCAVGAGISAKGGPMASCLGCMGFAGFSLIIEAVMPR